MRKIKGESLYADVIIISILLAVAFFAIVPIFHVLAKSFSSETAIVGGTVNLLPKDFSAEAYGLVFKSKQMIRSLGYTMYLTVLGTTVNVFITALGAYPLSKKDLPGRRIIWFMIIITMFFGGGLIPVFLVVRSLGLLDTVWAMILPAAVGTFNLILMKTFFQGLPDSLIESARMDGCPELLILFKIIMPLSAPIIATLSLFYGVGHWNQYFAALIYMTSPEKFPIQLMLQKMVGNNEAMDIPVAIGQMLPIEAIKAASVFVVIIPVVIVFPFIQKYFTKGALMGSIKE